MKTKEKEMNGHLERIFQGVDKINTGCEKLRREFCENRLIDLNRAVRLGAAGGSNDMKPVFITARFRTGSTLLWNLFRNVDDTISFYEPLHENLLTHIERATPTQKSHRGVQSYWDEYIPHVDVLRSKHRTEFGYWNLLLEENDHYPELYDYINTLIDIGQNNRAVLQFNRADFRLPWIKKHFPDAVIMHLYRDPREQWYSMVKSCEDEDLFSPKLNTNYDLLMWSAGLSEHFPFLRTVSSSYERHYYLWKLSYLMASRYSDLTLFFDEDIQGHPENAVAKIEKYFPHHEIGKIFNELVSKVKRGEWRRLKPDSWFEEIEERCEEKLMRLGLTEFFGLKTIDEIKAMFNRQWNEETKTSDLFSVLKEVVGVYVKNRSESAVFFSRVSKDLDRLVQESNTVGENSKKIVDLYLAEKQK